MVNAVIHALFHTLSLDTHALIVSHNGAGSGLKSVQLALRVAGRGILMTAPVIQYLWYMDDLFCLFGAPEDKIIVLSAVKLLAETAHLIQNTLLHHKQMADIINAGKEIRVKIRLKMRIKQRLSIHIQLILIGIEDVAVPMLVECLHHLVKSVLRQRIIMVSQEHKITGSHFQSRVCVAGNAPVASQNHIAHPGILLGVAL